MSAPVIWVIFPVAISAGLLFLLNKPKLVKTIGIVVSLLLVITALLQPIGNVLRIGGIVLDIKPNLFILGRSLLLENSDKFALSIVFSTVLLFLLCMDNKTVPTKFISLSLAIAGFLVAALAVQPFLYSAVLVEMAVLLMILMVKEKASQPENGIIRFLIYLSLAMPCILFAGWILGGAQASPSDATRSTSAAIFLLIGFSLWLAVFPFHSWVPQFSQVVNPYLFGFIFSLLPVVTLLSIIDYISSLVWLKSSTYLSPGLRIVGIIMIVTTGIFTSVEKDLKRILAATVLLETGFALVMLSLQSEQGVLLLYESFIPRILGLVLLSYSLSVFMQEGIQLNLQGIRGVIKRLPFASLGVLFSLISITGFPLFAGFPVRFELLRQLGQLSISSLLWTAVGLAGFLVATIRVFVFATFPDNEKWQINEKISQIVIICIGIILLVLLGWIPQLTANIFAPFATDLPTLW